MSNWGGYTGPFCRDCGAHMVPLVLSPADPVNVGHECGNCGLVVLNY